MSSRDIWSQVRKSPRQRYIDTEDKILRDRFEDPINYQVFYKDFLPDVEYRGWFYDDSSERKDLERKFLQVHPDDSIRQGEYIHWNGDVWLCLGVDKQYDNKQKGLIYQCLANQMNWIDEDGYHSFPFWSQSKVLRDPLSDGRAISLVEDTLIAFLQNNDETIEIKENLRFAFGVDTVFRVIERIDFAVDNTIKVIMKKDERRPTDDFINGIAENTVIEIIIEPILVNGNIGAQQQLIGTIRIDGVEDNTKTLSWSSSDDFIATVTSTGLIDFVSIGVCEITAEYNGIKNSVSVECTATPVNSTEYIIEPLMDTIPIGTKYEFTINKYVNGVIIPDTFSISDLTLGSGYGFIQVDGNTFSVENISDKNTNLTLEFDNTVDIFEEEYKLRMW